MDFQASVLRISTSTVPWRRSEGAVIFTTHMLIAHHMIYVAALGGKPLVAKAREERPEPPRRRDPAQCNRSDPPAELFRVEMTDAGTDNQPAEKQFCSG